MARRLLGASRLSVCPFVALSASCDAMSDILSGERAMEKEANASAEAAKK